MSADEDTVTTEHGEGVAPIRLRLPVGAAAPRAAALGTTVKQDCAFHRLDVPPVGENRLAFLQKNAGTSGWRGCRLARLVCASDRSRTSEAELMEI